MLIKKYILWIVLALLCVIGAIYAVFWSKKIDQQLTNDTLFFQSGSKESTGDAVQFLLSDFEGLLSGEEIGSWYDGEDGAFNVSGNLNE